MHKQKSRPANNFHCFDGMGLPYWRAIALGMTPAQNLSRGPDGAWWELKQDVDGYALQNGGMTRVQETKLNAAFYYRFFGTISHNIYGEKGGMSGGWWIDEENLAKIVNFAERCDYSLARAAAMLLVIPREWHDCGYLGCAWLRNQMKGFVGRGQPATGAHESGERHARPRGKSGDDESSPSRRQTIFRARLAAGNIGRL